MTICSPSTGNITLKLRRRAILPASGEQFVMLPSHKGNNCIMYTGLHENDVISNFVQCISQNTDWTESGAEPMKEPLFVDNIIIHHTGFKLVNAWSIRFCYTFQNNIGLILHAVEEYELSMRFLEHALQLNQK